MISRTTILRSALRSRWVMVLGVWITTLNPTLTAQPGTETGIPLMSTFGVRDYSEHNQTWTAVQDRTGMLYVGNKDVVLSFDGETWRSIPTGGLFIRQLALDAEDRIWVAGVGEFGYLETNPIGSRHYVSLGEKLPDDLRGTASIFNLLPTPHGIYLFAGNRLLRWHNGELTTPLESESSLFGWALDDEIVVGGRAVPLRSFDGQRWRTLFPDSTEPKNTFLYGCRLEDGSQLLFTRSDGVKRLTPDGTLSQWPTSIDAALREFHIVRALRLHDGSIAVALLRAGIAVLNPQGELLHYLDADQQSVPISITHGLAQDHAGDLWLLQNSGLVRIDWPSAITRFDQRRGLGVGTVKAIVRHRGKLYVGTSNGLQVLRPHDPSTLPPTPAHFESVPGSEYQTWALAVAGDDLLIGTRAGLSVLGPEEERARRVLPDLPGSVTYLSAAHPDHAWAKGGGFLWQLGRGVDGWEITFKVPEIQGVLRNVVEDQEGAVWVGVVGQGYYRLTRSPEAPFGDRASWHIEQFKAGHGLPEAGLTGMPDISSWDGRAMFLDASRVYHFDAERRSFVETPLAAQHPFGPVANLPTFAPGKDGAAWVRTFRDDAEAGPWKGRVFWHVSAAGTWSALPFGVADAVGENPVIYEESTADGSVLWVGGSEGLVRAEIPEAFLPSRPFRTVIRQVTDESDRPVALTATDLLELPHHAQRLSFTFSTDRIDDSQMRYQTRLTDYNEPWSPLRTSGELSLNYLPAGTHSLAVRSRDADGRIGSIDTFSFIVLPPWWATLWFRGLIALALIALVFAVMRWRLRAASRRTEELKQLVDARTQQLRENEQHLVVARDAADDANRAKSDFLAAMNHELRTPLNAILGFTQILHRDPSLSPKGRTQLETVSRNGRHLLGLINEVLDLAKIEAHQLVLLPAACSLHQLATELAATFETRATEKGLSFRLELDLGTPHVIADEPKLRQVLVNLLANAIKFTSRGEVVLSIEGQPGRVHFSVRDTGIGIATEEQAAVFEPFHQSRANAALTGNDQPGTGLGLPISQRLITLMGSSIDVTTPPAGGSCFSFTLALPPASHAPASQRADRITGYEGQRRRILVVDDIETNRAILRDLLTLVGFTIEEAATGEEALARYEANPADLVLLDLRLPGISGEDVARQLRALPTRRPRLIAVSASVFELHAGNARTVGCDAFVPKPVEESVLLAAIAKQLRLTWCTEPTAEATLPHPNPAISRLTPEEIVALPLPSRSELESWLELARRGDQRRLRAAINAPASAGPDADFRREIDLLLQRFQTGAVRKILAQVLDKPSAPPAPNA